MKKNYGYIDLFKFISAITIVAIHTQPMQNYTDSFFYSLYGYAKCFSIPFFFTSSSFLFFTKIDLGRITSEENKKYLKKWTIRLLQIYLLYSFFNIILMIPDISSKNLFYWIRFFVLGENNGYLWFPIALVEAVIIIYGAMYLVTLIYKKTKIVPMILLAFVMLVSMLVMMLLQFYSNLFQNTMIVRFIAEYYRYFGNVRNVISALFYCSVGASVLFLDKYYKKNINRVLLVIFIVCSYIEYIVVANENLYKEEYSTFLLSFVYVFLLLEFMHTNISSVRYVFLRKASNIMYFQHRYVLIFLALLFQITDNAVFENDIIIFILTILILLILTKFYLRMEKTKLNRIIKYLY